MYIILSPSPIFFTFTSDPLFKLLLLHRVLYSPIPERFIRSSKKVQLKSYTLHKSHISQIQPQFKFIFPDCILPSHFRLVDISICVTLYCNLLKKFSYWIIPPQHHTAQYLHWICLVSFSKCWIKFGSEKLEYQSRSSCSSTLGFYWSRRYYAKQMDNPCYFVFFWEG